MTECNGGLKFGWFLGITLQTLLCCTWYLWNSEAREFLRRKLFATSSSFTRRSRRVGNLARQNVPVTRVPESFILVQEAAFNQIT